MSLLKQSLVNSELCYTRTSDKKSSMLTLEELKAKYNLLFEIANNFKLDNSYVNDAGVPVT